MVRIREAILVEGRYDKNALRQVVDAPIFETGGFGIFKDHEKIAFLRRVAEKRGLILLTDSDGAGFVIRNRLKSQLPPDRLLQAYIPDISGKERRKHAPSKEGLLGVEGMMPEILMEALRRSGAHFLEEGDPAHGDSPITRQELFALGLMGGENSAARRDYIKRQLELPAHLGTGAFLDALNLITDRETVEQLLHSFSSEYAHRT